MQNKELTPVGIKHRIIELEDDIDACKTKIDSGTVTGLEAKQLNRLMHLFMATKDKLQSEIA